MIAITFLFVITGLYAILISSLTSGFDKVNEFMAPQEQPGTGFSIVVPFRNEATYLPLLLDSIDKLTYARNQYEFIFVDDESTDNSVEIIHQHLSATEISYSIIENKRLSNSPKKDAILTAIKKAQFEWIITTDADCEVPEFWLSNFGAFSIVYHSKMIVGPVMYTSEDFSFLEHFQILEFLSLQGVTVGGFGIKKPFLCNGANLAYKKEVFLELNGFQGNDTIASGDDVFLFEKFYKAYPNDVHFLKSKSSLVTTHVVKTWKSLIHQRMRWAAKSSSYSLSFGKQVGVIVLLMNLSLFVSLIMMFVSIENSTYFIFSFGLKKVLDYKLIHKTSRFYRRKNKKVRDFIFGSLLYPFFSSYIVLRTLTSTYNWKGREFKK
ncbi:MAG: glycosyltransferase [Flavobacteriaceae bacterium]